MNENIEKILIRKIKEVKSIDLRNGTIVKVGNFCHMKKSYSFIFFPKDLQARIVCNDNKEKTQWLVELNPNLLN